MSEKTKYAGRYATITGRVKPIERKRFEEIAKKKKITVSKLVGELVRGAIREKD